MTFSSGCMGLLARADSKLATFDPCTCLLGLGNYGQNCPIMLCSDALNCFNYASKYAHIMLVHNIIHEHTWPCGLLQNVCR